MGLLTDVHYADKPAAGTRYYRESLGKVRVAVDQFNDLKVDLAIELGDIVDAAQAKDKEIEYLKRIDSEYGRFRGERHYVLGNHCVWTLSKKEFLHHSGAERPHYSFDRGGFHIIVLDACYRADGTPYGERNFVWSESEIPPAEREWLSTDLAQATNPAIVFVHQRLDVGPPYGIRSANAVRKILETSGKTLAVFQGHHHINDHRLVNGVHYCTLAAVIEGSGETNNAFARLDVFPDGSLKLRGFHQQVNRDLPRTPSIQAPPTAK